MRFRGTVAISLYRWAILIALLVAPALYFAYQAIVDPKVAFLVPSLRAEWVRHRAQEVVPYLLGRFIEEVEFSREFEFPEEPRDIVLEVAAFGKMKVLLNRRLVWATDGRNWKRPAVVHLEVQRGKNRLAIRVRNAGGFPALLISDPEFLRTPGGWRAALGTAFADPLDVVSASFRAERPGPLQLSPAWSILRYATPLWLVLWLAVAILALFPTVSGAVEAPRASSASAFSRVETLLPFVFILAAVCLNLVNAARYPYDRSPFDWQAHVAYVERVADTWSPPMAKDGWQMFQPPLYYYIAAVIYTIAHSLKAVQFVNALAGSLLPVVAWLQIKLFRPRDIRGAWVATALVAFLPMSLYMNPIISNETFAGTVIAFATYMVLRLLASEHPGRVQPALTGVASGAALLAKLTGLFSFLIAIGCLGWAALWTPRHGRWRLLATYSAVVLLIAGWFYGRDVVAYGKPFVGAWDRESGFAFVQEPTFRTAGFFLNVGSVFFQHPRRSIWSGFLDGHYATLWADAQLNFFKQGNEAAFFWMGIVLLLGAAPSIATMLGVGALFGKALSSPNNVVDLAMVSVIVTTWWALVFFAVTVPTYSSIKAFYFLSLVPSLAVCFATGRDLLARRTPWAVGLLDSTALTIAAISGYLFRC